MTAGNALLSVTDLQVTFTTDSGTAEAVRGVDLDLDAGEVLALVGESGSGKSVTSLAIIGLLPRTATATGSIRLGGREILDLGEAERNRLRGKDIGMIFQEPMTALNPTMTIGAQIAEAIRNHEKSSPAEVNARVIDLLTQVGIPHPETKSSAYPHEMSGGQRQRVVIAIALACRPAVIIADEPTTALDVTVQAEILDLIRDLAKASNTAFLLVTHNMGVVADIADRVVVMVDGKTVESGTAADVLLRPREEYTRNLLGAVPRLPLLIEDSDPAEAPASEPSAGDPVLEVSNASVIYHHKGVEVRALDDVTVSIPAAQTLGLVGESGSGKSTFGKVALGLESVRAGRVALLGTEVTGRWRDRRVERALRSRIGVVFQDPGSSIDPRMTIGDAIAEPMSVHPRIAPRTPRQRRAKVRELLERVRFPGDYAVRYPHELSGGQRQRVGLARAVALAPELLIADEPTSALDVSVQATVLDLLQELQEQLSFACLFISHDLAVVHRMSDRVAVMKQGRIVETGAVDEVLTAPQHPYSQRLLQSVPVPDPIAQRQRRALRAEGSERVG